MFKQAARTGFLVVVAMVLLTNCAIKPKPIPTAYYQKEYEMAVRVVQCSEQPKMTDSDAGGLIGLLVRSARAGTMREKMQGIRGETVRELLRQKISEKLEEHFDVVEDREQLTTEVTVQHWGWFVPSTVLGIKTGSYQLRITGFVEVYDNTQKRRQRVGYVTAMSEKPLGNDPSPEEAQGALLRATDDFANKAVAVILGEKP